MNRPALAPVSISGVQGAINKRLADEIASHASTIKQLAEGQGVLRGRVTLNASATTTTVTDADIPALAMPQLTAGTGTWTSTALRVSSVAKGSFVITHSNEAATDRVVFWQIGITA